MFTVVGDLFALVAGPRRCSRCRSRYVLPDNPGPLEWLTLPFLGIKPYICHDCGHGFYSWRYFRR